MYAVHGGNVVTSQTIDRLGNDAMIQLVDRMPRGGKNKKKATKKMEESEQSASDTSSSEANEAFEQTIAKTGQGGWSRGGAWTRKMLEMNEEEEELLIHMSRDVRVEMRVGAESVIEGIRTFVREQRRKEKGPTERESGRRGKALTAEARQGDEGGGETGGSERRSRRRPREQGQRQGRTREMRRRRRHERGGGAEAGARRRSDE